MSRGRPVIGLTCYVEDVDRSPWVAQRSAVLPYRYVGHVERSGAAAVLLPPRLDVDDAMADAVVAGLDGLVVVGGADVEAARYGAAPHASSQDPRPDRDAWELALVAAARRVDLPVLGICRGMQVMAVADGGVLDQHLPEVVGHDGHSPRLGAYTSHVVTPVAGTTVAGALGDDPVDVPTYHHQAVKPGSLEGTGWVPAAWHDDGTLEAMEDPAGCFRVAVQWHAEESEGAALFEALSAGAAARAAGRSASD